MTPEEQETFLKKLRGLDSAGKAEARKILGMTPEYSRLDTSMKEFDVGKTDEFDINKKINELYQKRLSIVKETVQTGAFYMRSFEAGGKFRKALQESLIESEKFYGSTEAAQRAFSGLTSGMKSFIGFGETTAKVLTKNATHFEALGLQTTKLADILDTAVLSYGVGEEKLEQLSLRVMQAAVDLQMPATELATNWAAAQKSLAYTSGKVENIFYRLQKTARTTGIDFSTLTQAFGDQMDTFSGASQVAGRLNAVLGDSIFNSVELLGMNEAERVSTIADRVRRKVGNVDDLKKFELKAVASSMGLSVDDTRRLLRGDMSVEKALQSAAGKENPMDKSTRGTALELDKFKKIIMETRSLMENQRQRFYGANIAAGLREGRHQLARQKQLGVAGQAFMKKDENLVKFNRLLKQLPPHLQDAVIEMGALDEGFVRGLVNMSKGKKAPKGGKLVTAVREQLTTARDKFLKTDPFRDASTSALLKARRDGVLGHLPEQQVIVATRNIATATKLIAAQAKLQELRDSGAKKSDDQIKKLTALVTKLTLALKPKSGEQREKDDAGKKIVLDGLALGDEEIKKVAKVWTEAANRARKGSDASDVFGD